MKKDNRLTLGIIGCGTIGRLHVRNILQNFFDVEIRCICDIDIEKVRTWAKKESLPDQIRFTTDLEDVMEDEKIDAVVIATQITQHTDILIRSIEAGKDIFCEKQIGVDPVKIKKVIDLAEKNGVKLQVGFHRRFDTNYIKARDMIKKGSVGEIQIVRAITRLPESLPARYLKKGLFAGHFNEVTSHDFDILRYITDSEIEELFSIGKVLIEPRFADIDDYDTIMVSLRFDNGSIGNVDGSMQATYGFDQRVEVFGSKGCIFINNQRPNQMFLYDGTAGKIDRLLHEGWSSKQAHELFYMTRYKDAFIMEFREFFRSIIDNTEPICTGLDGLKNILVCDAAKKSADTNKPVKIDYSICK